VPHELLRAAVAHASIAASTLAAVTRRTRAIAGGLLALADTAGAWD
jgi:hypothetical protein